MMTIRRLLDFLRQDKTRHWLMTAILVTYAAMPLLSPAVDSASFRHVLIVFALVCVATALYRPRIRKEYLLYVLLWVEAFAATLLSSYVSVTSASVTYLLFAIMVVLFASYNYSANDIRFFVKFYVCFATMIAVLIILSWLTDRQHTPGCYSVGILGITKNPNYLNSVIILGAAFLMYRLTLKISVGDKLICAAMLAIMIFGSLQTGTRAAILAFAICAAFVIAYQLIAVNGWAKMRTFLKKNWITIIVVALVVFALAVFGFHNAPASLKRRILKLFSDNLRMEMWLKNIVEFAKQPVLGMGLNATTAFTKTLNLPVSNIHNTILQFACEQGVLGVAIFAAILSVNLLKTRKQDRFLILLMIIAMYVPIFFQNNLTSNTFWWPLVFLEVFTSVSEREGLNVK